jgi:hypothetical protein
MAVLKDHGRSSARPRYRWSSRRLPPEVTSPGDVGPVRAFPSAPAARVCPATSKNMIMPQLLSEIDGVQSLENVIVIGASNREDMIDPAILRPGRLDVKIKIERPDAEAPKDICSKYVLKELPLHPEDMAEHGGSAQATVEAMIQRTVERMYTESEENRFLEVTYANGDNEVLSGRPASSPPPWRLALSHGVDAPARLGSGLAADQGPDVHDALTLLAGDAGPVIRVGGVRAGPRSR